MFAGQLSFPQLAVLMDVLFKYFSGSLEEFLTRARSAGDNHLIKIRLAPSALPEYSGCRHVLDNFAVNHIMHRHSGKRERLRGQEPVRRKNGNSSYLYTKDINDTTLYKRKKNLKN